MGIPPNCNDPVLKSLKKQRFKVLALRWGDLIPDGRAALGRSRCA